jgi:hypothetical protein
MDTQISLIIKTKQLLTDMSQGIDSLCRSENIPVPPIKGCPTISRLDGDTSSSRLPEKEKTVYN